MPDYSWAEREDWESAWQPLIDAIGTDFAPDEVTWGIEVIEKGIIRRYLEPIEFDAPLHYDEAVAKKHGYAGIIAPYSGLATWTTVGVWSPGQDPVYLSDGRNDLPRSSRTMVKMPGPDTNGGFATDVEYEYLRPFVLGDRVGTRGRKLLSVLPKQTSVGRGAFSTTESEIVNQDMEVIAVQRLSTYGYVAMKRS